MAENVSKPKSTEKPKNLETTKSIEKVKKVEKAVATTTKKKPNRIARFWRSTIGELRKVSWPTPQEAWRLTKIVLLVVLFLAGFLVLLYFVFSRAIAALVSI